MSEAHDFLEPLWGHGVHSVCYQRKPAPFNVLGFAATIEQCERDCMRLSQQECDSWFSVHAMPVAPTHGRGRSEDVVEVVSLPADIDWADDAHRGADLMSRGEVMERLGSFTPEPSIVVMSGHGLQCYWLLAHPVPASEGLALTKLLHAALTDAGLKPERHDLASVLRLPGTINYKREPVVVELLRLEISRRYLPAELALAWALPEPAQYLSTGIALPDLRPGIEDDDITPIEWFVEHYDIETEVYRRGWQFHSINHYGGQSTQFVTRPGKPVTDGHSGRLFPGEGLLVWSSNAHPLVQNRYYDVAELVIAYEHGGDKAGFASHVRRDLMPKPALATVYPFRTASEALVAPAEPAQWPRLPEAFWRASPVLEHIRAAADASSVSREAVMLSVCALALLHVPNVISVPPPPRRASLNLFVGIVGPPGTGKGSAMDCAEMILAPPHATVRTALGTAEGFIRAFHQRDPDHQGKGIAKLVRHFHPVLVRTDEVGNFAAMAGGKDSRSESLLAEMKQCWMGEGMGKGYASEDKGLLIAPHTYRAAAVMGIAPVKAEPLFGDLGGGFPERLLFAPSPLEQAPGAMPPDPGALDWRSPWFGWRQDFGAGFPIVNPVRDAVHALNLPYRLGQGGDPLDAHAALAQLKLAAAVATLHGRIGVEWWDWELAETLIVLSRATRTTLLQAIAGTHADDERRAGVRAGRIEQARLTVRAEHEQQMHGKRVIDVAKRTHLVLRKRGDTKRKEVRSLINPKQRDLFDEALQWAIDEGWVVEVIEQTPQGVRRTLRLGPNAPS